MVKVLPLLWNAEINRQRLLPRARFIRSPSKLIPAYATISTDPSRLLSIGTQSVATCSRWFLARGFFYPEDVGDTFLRNVGSHKIYTAPHPRRRHSLKYFYVVPNSSLTISQLALYTVSETVK
jgi:hypothetical protein